MARPHPGWVLFSLQESLAVTAVDDWLEGLSDGRWITVRTPRAAVPSAHILQSALGGRGRQTHCDSK